MAILQIKTWVRPFWKANREIGGADTTVVSIYLYIFIVIFRYFCITNHQCYSFAWRVFPHLMAQSVLSCEAVPLCHTLPMAEPLSFSWVLAEMMGQRSLSSFSVVATYISALSSASPL